MRHVLILWTALLAIVALPVAGQEPFHAWAATPPMGWNSWDCYGPTVEEHEVRANAAYMAKHLKRHGWEYVVVDIRWFVENDKAGGYNQTDPRYVIDAFGRYLPAVNRFPSAAGGAGFQPLAEYIHSLGLKFGIHLMRGVPRVAVERKLPVKGTAVTADQIFSPELQCTWLKDNYTITDTPGGQAYYNSLFELYAAWGVDYVKIDDLSRPYHAREIEMIRKAIDGCGRPIVLSMSPGATPVEQGEHARGHANAWRMVDDLWDLWRDVVHLMDVAVAWTPFIGPAWPDCDMIPLGRISIRGERGAERMTRLSPDEQRTLMTFFTIVRSPLMFGGDLPSNDAFTLSLLTNEEVLRMHRDGSNVTLKREGNIVTATSVNARTGERYLALFNVSNDPKAARVKVTAADFGLEAPLVAINPWDGERWTVGKRATEVSIRPHASVLLKAAAPVETSGVLPWTREGVPLDSILLSDPFILADAASAMYYMTGTGGLLWKSKDLQRWNGPYRVTATNPRSWMGANPMIWAAELHAYKGRYYYFGTFTNRAMKIDTVRGAAIDRRACHVLVSDRPDGPYVPAGDETYLPADRPTLDATLWVDVDSIPYLIYCHEWLQNWNGTVEKIRLKPDLSGTVGKGRVLFFASESPWSRERMGERLLPNRVTDGPWLFRTGPGRLGMIWTSWVLGDYTQGVAYSESGTLDGPWVHEPEPVTPPNHGHGMMFRALDGRLLMSVHSHREVNGRYIRIPRLFEVDLSGEKLVVGKQVR
jgi:hypothetical protein